MSSILGDGGGWYGLRFTRNGPRNLEDLDRLSAALRRAHSQPKSFYATFYIRCLALIRR